MEETTKKSLLKPILLFSLAVIISMVIFGVTFYYVGYFSIIFLYIFSFLSYFLWQKLEGKTDRKFISWSLSVICVLGVLVSLITLSINASIFYKVSFFQGFAKLFTTHYMQVVYLVISVMCIVAFSTFGMISAYQYSNFKTKTVKQKSQTTEEKPEEKPEEKHEETNEEKTNEEKPEEVDSENNK